MKMKLYITKHGNNNTKTYSEIRGHNTTMNVLKYFMVSMCCMYTKMIIDTTEKFCVWKHIFV